MGKTLILVRHGKANHPISGTSDFSRTLKKSGIADSHMMAERLKDQGIIPEHVISSPAPRALSTAKAFSEIWGFPFTKIVTELFIYEADINALLSILNNLDNSFDSVALFGHNPAITEFANYLSDEGILNMPTSSVVVVDFPFKDWKYLGHETGTVSLFDYPESTKGGL